MRILNKIIPLLSNFSSLEGGNMHTCAYCLMGDKPYLFDADNPGDVTSQYAPELALNGIKVEDLGGVFVTHAHGDHVGGAIELHNMGIPLMLPEAEVPYLEDMPAAFDHFFAPSFRALGQEEYIPELRMGSKLGYIAGPCKVDRPVKDDEVFALASDVHIRVVPIPGHTDNSVGYYWEETGAIFVGDAIQSYGQCVGALPILQNPPAFERTLKKLLDMNVQVMMTGHMFQTSGTHGVTANNVKFQKEIDNFLLENLEIHQIMLDAMNDTVAEKGDVPFTELIVPAMDRIAKHIPILADYKAPIPRPYNFPQLWLDTLVAYYRTVKGEIK